MTMTKTKTHTSFTHLETAELVKIFNWIDGIQRIPNHQLSPNERNLLNVNCDDKTRHHVNLNRQTLHRVIVKLSHNHPELKNSI